MLTLSQINPTQGVIVSVPISLACSLCVGFLTKTLHAFLFHM